MSLTPTGSRSFGKKGSGFRLVVVAVLLALGIGTLVFRSIEGWSILTSLYVTVQTVTTVGYGDVTPQSAPGRAFELF
jgi:voltage-gated potassium channel